MSYFFQADDTVEANVHRILGEQIEQAIHQLANEFAEDPAEAIHDARKRLKKARSVLRLIRKAIDRNTYKREKNVLRDTGRSLSKARDSEVYQETLADLLHTYERTLDIEAFTEIRERLADLHKTQLQMLTEREDPIGALVVELKDSHSRLNQLALRKTGWEAIAKNLNRIYRQGQERFHTAYQTDTGAAFHEWRKRVKDLWYNTRLLKQIWPEVMDAFKQETHQLSSILGDEHDITEFRQFLLTHTEELAVTDVHKNVLMPLMDHRQYELRHQAKDLGQKLYAESPESFTTRLSKYWETWFVLV